MVLKYHWYANVKTGEFVLGAGHGESLDAQIVNQREEPGKETVLPKAVKTA